MLRMEPKTGARDAKQYFLKELDHEGDYFLKSIDEPGYYGGKAAVFLGLEPDKTVDKDSFFALIDNLHPQTGEQLTPRMRDDRRIWAEMNFSLPKAVSWLALTRDEQIWEVAKEAVNETMREMETDMAVRVRKGDKSASKENRTTGNMVYAVFPHKTARPAEEVAIEGSDVPQPHAHFHVPVLNMSFDQVEGQWKAGELGNINLPYYESRFHSRVAGKLTEMGYEVEKRGRSFDIANISRDFTDKTSHRTQQIDAAADKYGVKDAKAKDALNRTTRHRKPENLTIEELQVTWHRQLTPEEHAMLDNARGQPRTTLTMSTKEAVDYALGHTLHKKSVVPQQNLVTTALGYAVGQPGDFIGQVEHEIRSRPDILKVEVNGQTQITTQDILNDERAMLNFCRDELGTCKALGPDDFQFKPIIVDGKERELNPGQQAAVRHVLESRDRIIGIRGAAGVGKTTSVMAIAIPEITAGNRKEVFTFAPSGSGVDTLKESGFSNADTVQQLLVNKRMQQRMKDSVIWVDEAGLLSVQEMKQLFDLAGEQKARVILMGDTRQHHSVQRGDAMRNLETEGVLISAQVTEIVRQKGVYKQAVDDLSQGNVKDAFDKLDRLGFVHEAETTPDMHQAVVQEYLQLTSQGKNPIIVAPAHVEGAAITKLLRQELKDLPESDPRHLNALEKPFMQLHSLNWDEAQKGDVRNYQPGQVVQFQRPATGDITRSERLTITGSDDQGNILAQRQKRIPGKPEQITLPLDHTERFNVYEPRALDLSPGDSIRITQGSKTRDKAHDLRTGNFYQVQEFTPGGNIRLTNGWIVDQQFGHLAYGYYSTSHTAQSKTRTPLIAQSELSFGATNLEQGYVSLSRGVDQAKWFTTDRARLMQLLEQSGTRMSATELMRQQIKDPTPQQFADQKQERYKRYQAWVNQTMQYGKDAWENLARTLNGRDHVRKDFELER